MDEARNMWLDYKKSFAKYPYGGHFLRLIILYICHHITFIVVTLFPLNWYQTLTLRGCRYECVATVSNGLYSPIVTSVIVEKHQAIFCVSTLVKTYSKENSS